MCTAGPAVLIPGDSTAPLPGAEQVGFDPCRCLEQCCSYILSIVRNGFEPRADIAKVQSAADLLAQLFGLQLLVSRPP
jgi:hypothetical protein